MTPTENAYSPRKDSAVVATARIWTKPQPQSTWASIHVSDDGWRIEGLKRSDRGDRDWLLSDPQGRAAGNVRHHRVAPFRTLAAAKAWVDQHSKAAYLIDAAHRTA